MPSGLFRVNRSQDGAPARVENRQWLASCDPAPVGAVLAYHRARLFPLHVSSWGDRYIMVTYLTSNTCLMYWYYVVT